ncbi:unnamed protein product, partial [Ectocarpus sp. 13 AM-2016]
TTGQAARAAKALATLNVRKGQRRRGEPRVELPCGRRRRPPPSAKRCSLRKGQLLWKHAGFDAYISTPAAACLRRC